MTLLLLVCGLGEGRLQVPICMTTWLITCMPPQVAPVVRVSPAEPKADQLTPAREEETLPDLLKAATIEESKPTKAASGAPAEKEGHPQQPESDAQAELEVSSMPTNPSALLPSLAPEAKAKGERPVVWPLQHPYCVLAFFAITCCLQSLGRDTGGPPAPPIVQHTCIFVRSSSLC